MRLPVSTRLFLALCAVAGLPMLAGAAPTHFKHLTLHHAFARATVPGQEVGAVYLTIENDGDQPEVLTEARCTAADQVTLHQTQHSGDMTHMHHAPSFVIPAHGQLVLAPGGQHLMLESLHGPLQVGSAVELTLHFEPSGDVRIPVPVQSLQSEGEEVMPMPTGHVHDPHGQEGGQAAVPGGQ